MFLTATEKSRSMTNKYFVDTDVLLDSSKEREVSVKAIITRHVKDFSKGSLGLFTPSNFPNICLYNL
jgi:hypothetical protein